jgi:transcriptional regulator with XRE-family HTH domain
MQVRLSRSWKAIFQNAQMEAKVRATVAVQSEHPKRELGRRLKAARKRAGLTQAQVGERLELGAHSAVGQWERGTTQVETVNLILAAQLYNESLDWLAFGKMGTLEKRIAALPESLREGMMEQVTSILDNAERLYRRNPKMFGDAVVLDGDPRLTRWSAKDKSLRQPKKAPGPLKKK